MSFAITEQTQLVRELVRDVLVTASEPLTANDIAATDAAKGLGFTAIHISNALSHLASMRVTPFPIMRRRTHGKGNALWEYYDPTRIRPTPTTKPNVPRRKAKVRHQSTPAALPSVATTSQGYATSTPDAGQAKAIVLSLGGVSVRIELEGAK
ncbi:hypothetical protein [Candidimonas nitroreducens]|uniref:Uncharacterized protein n=1 Tax=Candidimonas nitroreducens TaxID=683354 RepID=A0A225M1M2_9BURK|nr:hypothetical protein [Candidimonas nitroreducens]OWT55244.1 hypothetical protein CEY11_21275 [Candidimonas nitroreducens]